MDGEGPPFHERDGRLVFVVGIPFIFSPGRRYETFLIIIISRLVFFLSLFHSSLLFLVDIETKERWIN